MLTDEGSRHSVLGFETEAEAWAEADRKLEIFRQMSPPETEL